MRAFVYIAVACPQGLQDGVGPHVTLVYSNAATGSIDTWVKAVERAASVAPMALHLTGNLERFGAGDDVCLAATVETEPVRGIRQMILAALAEGGASAVGTYPDFRPHITVGDAEAGIAPGAVPVLGIYLRLEDESGAVVCDTRADDACVEQRWSDVGPLARDAVPATRAVPEGYIVGRSMRICRAGSVWDRYTGRPRGRSLTPDLLADAVRNFGESGDGVPIDRDHRETEPGGLVLGMALVDGGESIAVLPAYNTRRPSLCEACQAGRCDRPEHEPMAEYVDRLQGALWPSPRLQWSTGDQQFHSARTGAPLGRFRIPNVAITTEPATCHTDVDEVRLAATPMESTMDHEMLIAALASTGMPEDVLARIRGALAEMPDPTPEQAAETIAAVLSGVVVGLAENSADQSDPPAEAGPEPSAEGGAMQDVEPGGEAPAEGAEPDGSAPAPEPSEGDSGEGEGDAGASDDDPAEGAQGEQRQGMTPDDDRRSAVDAEAIADLVVSRLRGAPPAPVDPPADWDPLGGVAEERFSEGAARGAWGRDDRALYLSLRKRIEAGNESARSSFDEMFGRRPHVLEERLSAPGAPPKRRAVSAAQQLLDEGASHPHGTSGVLRDWERKNDPRLAQLD